jgi:MFS family permease
MVPRLVSERELMSAIGLNSAAFNGATLVGPLLGGVLIIPFGVGGLMLLNAFSYIAIVAALILMRPQPVIDYGPRLSTLDSIREGLSFIRGDPVLRWVVALSIFTALFTRPYIQLLPAEAQFLGVGALQLSLLLAASGTGALAGALVTASLGALKRRGALLVGAAFAHGTLLVFFGLQQTVIGAMVFVCLTSLAVMVFMGMANTLMQTRAPDSLRGRVMSVQTMVFIGFMPLGQMLLGSVGTVVGINDAFLIGGFFVMFLAGYAALRVTALREAVSGPGRRAVASS